jgi:uncharacterized membrane protein YjjP (DUF1212 family)
MIGQTQIQEIEITNEWRPYYRRAIMYGFFCAVFFERTFSDYIFTYLAAFFTMTLAVIQTARSTECPCKLW